jgi:hypothetical protein
VLIDHRVDDVNERFVAVEQAVSAGQQITLEPALALVLREHLHDASGAGQVIVDLRVREGGVPLLVGGLEYRLQTVGSGFVGPEDAEIVRVEPDDVGQPLAQYLRGLGDGGAGVTTSTP